MNKIITVVLLIIISVFSFSSCKKDNPGSSVSAYDDTPYEFTHDGFPQPNLPADNPLTVEGVKLGRFLFYDTKLSANNNIGCASCHGQTTGFSDPNTFSIGTDGLTGTRQAMSVFNLAWSSNGFFWDGRAELLRHQALMPIQDPLEMNETLDNVISKLESDVFYPRQFEKAFGSEEITPLRISLALEQFMFSIVSNRSKFDLWNQGLAELTEEEERGRYLFFEEYNPGFPEQSGADCQHCHGSARFSNNQYMNNGLDTDAEFTDLGRELVTGNPADRAKFKVTTLRNIELTAPYMHDGRFQTLEEVIEHYNLVKQSSTLQSHFLQQLPQGLQLTDSDKAALVAFLKTLTDIPLMDDPRYANPF